MLKRWSLAKSGKAPIAVAIILAVCSASKLPAQAAEVADAATGFSVVLPEGISAVRADRPDQAVTFAVRSSLPSPRIPLSSANMCQLAFRPAPQNAGFSQAQLNEMASSTAGQDSVRTAMERTFRVEALSPFELRGARGVEVVGVPLAGATASETRVVVSMLETPRGRMTMSCAVQAADLQSGLAVFRMIRYGIRMP